MAYYVRKIARAKWDVLDKGSEKIIENYKADAVANDLRTSNNTLSLWRVEDMSEKSKETAIVINGLLGDKISRIDLLFIPDYYLQDDFDIQQSDGVTVVSKYKNCHYNVENLTVKKHMQFAKDVVLKIIKEEDERANRKADPEHIFMVNERKQLEIIKKWIKAGEINPDDIDTKLSDKQKRLLG